MNEVEFFNKYFEGHKEIHKLVGIMEFYRYRYKTCKIRNNVGAPPSISVLFPIDDYTIPYILEILNECNIVCSPSYRIDTYHYLIEGAKTITTNREPSIYVKPRFSTLLSEGKYKRIFEELSGNQ